MPPPRIRPCGRAGGSYRDLRSRKPHSATMARHRSAAATARRISAMRAERSLVFNHGACGFVEFPRARALRAPERAAAGATAQSSCCDGFGTLRPPSVRAEEAAGFRGRETNGRTARPVRTATLKRTARVSGVPTVLRPLLVARSAIRRNQASNPVSVIRYNRVSFQVPCEPTPSSSVTRSSPS
jgi:hypothetical protein